MEGVYAPKFVARFPIQINNNDIDAHLLICAIESGNLDGSFRISLSNNLDACELYTEIQLNREKVDSYVLNVSLTFGTSTNFALVNIQVTDVNDNAPNFIFLTTTNKKENELFDDYFAVVPSLAPPKTHVITLKVIFI